MRYELILAIFPDDTEQAVTQIERYNASKDTLGITEAVALIKTAEDKNEVQWMGAKSSSGAKVGAVAGALIGLLAGPAGVVIGGAAGAAAGKLTVNLSHANFSKEMLKTVEAGLEPGSSAVLVIIEFEKRHLILNDLKEKGAVIKNESVESDQIERAAFIQPGSGISQT
jgi:uncharacterized membrane protein